MRDSFLFAQKGRTSTKRGILRKKAQPIGKPGTALGTHFGNRKVRVLKERLRNSKVKIGGKGCPRKGIGLRKTQRCCTDCRGRGCFPGGEVERGGEKPHKQLLLG